MRCGIGVGVVDFGSLGGVSDVSDGGFSVAAMMLAAETQGLALDFTDDYYFTSQGFYGSAAIKDTTTPANNYDSSPTKTASSLLTYTSPSVKMCMGPSGTLRYGAHNLAVQSGTLTTTWAASQATITAFGTPPAGYAQSFKIDETAVTNSHLLSQAVTGNIVGATYSLGFVAKAGERSFCAVSDGNSGCGNYFDLSNGTVGGTTTFTAPISANITALGDGWYFCAITFAATSTTINARLFLSTNGTAVSYAGVLANGIFASAAHLRRTPSDSTYLTTTTAARYALPLEWNSAGVAQGVLVEEARTNLCLQASDLTNAVWIKTSATTAKTATGPDGVTNSATTLTASAANGVALQNITSTSAARSGSVYLKRRTGTGAVSVAIGETTGSELVSNGTFASDITGWTNISSGTGSISWNASGWLNINTTDASNIGQANQPVTTVAGKLYRISVTVPAGSGGTTFMRVGIGSGGAQLLADTSIAANTTGSAVFVATSTTSHVGVYTTGTAVVGYADSISVLEVTESTIDLSSGNWVRGSIENKTITNPCVAIKLATSGDAVDVAYAQMESGAFITSPIETFAASVTRAADNVSLATSAFPYSSTQSTMAAYVYLSDPFTTAVLVALFRDGSNFAYIAHQGASLDRLAINVNSGGVSQANLQDFVTRTNANAALGMVAQSNNVIGSLNGATFGTQDTAVTMPTAATSIQIGQFGAFGQPNSYVKKIVYLPLVKTQTELNTLTASITP